MEWISVKDRLPEYGAKVLLNEHHKKWENPDNE